MNLLRRQCILGGLLFIVSFLVYQGPLSHVIYYNEQHRLFLYSFDFYNKRFDDAGLWEYLTDFIVQFFYYPILGSAIVALILTAVFLLGNRIVIAIIDKEDRLLLSVWPPLLLLFYTMSVENSLSLLVKVFLSFALVSIILFFVKPSFLPIFKSPFFFRGQHDKLYWLASSLLILGYMLFGYVYFVKSFNRSERLMLKAEMYVRSRDWDNALDYTERYMNSGKTNQLISYFHSLALYHKGRLLQSLFKYPQHLGVKALFFPWNGDSRTSEYGHFLFDGLGYIHEACRWETEAMVVWGETSQHLENLACYYVLEKKPAIARKFIRRLEKTLFYKKRGEQIEDSIHSRTINQMENAFEAVPDSFNLFSNVRNIGPDLERLCEINPSNKMAFEYYMAYLLLSNNVERFVDNLKYINNFSYTVVPRYFEEALYIYELQSNRVEGFENAALCVSQSTRDRFKRYYDLVENQQMEQLQKEFGDSYWFYINYVSPYGDKVLSY